MKKKLTALLMSIAVLIGTFVPISGVSATQGITHEREVSLMAALGIVTGYPDSSGRVRIDDYVYSAGDTAAQDLLGYSVEFYYQDNDGDAVIKWIEPNSANSETMVIYGADIDSVSGRKVSFYNSEDKLKTVTIASNADIIYNGVRDDSVSLEAMQSLNSETVLIDNGRSGSYNVVIITDYEYYLVDGYSSDTGIVNDYSAEKSLSLNEDDYDAMRIYMNGSLVSASSIMQGQVLAAAVSKDGNVLKAEILTGSVTGSITSMTDSSVTIAGTEYYISPSYAGVQLKIGRTGTFWFDRLGKVVRADVERSQTSKYGYLMRYYSETDGVTSFVARILTSAGSVEEFKVKDTISFNGSKTASGDAYNKMYNGKDCRQLITYSLGSNNEVVSINTADERYIGVDEENVDAFTLNYTGTGRYRRNNMCFNSKYLVDSTTPIFLIPYNGEENEYSVQNTSYLTNNYTYDISVYDIDSYMYASAIVLRENVIEPENLRTKRSFIVTSVYEAVDE